MDQSEVEAEYTITVTIKNNNGTTLAINDGTFKLPIGINYRKYANDPYTFNTTPLDRVITAKNRINSIVAANEGSSVYQKLLGFKQAICNLVEYDPNPEATDSDSWQLVNIFDGDPETKVNSDGYAKGFKYLCDLSGISCITMTGKFTDLQRQTSSHTWNVVELSVPSAPNGYTMLYEPSIFIPLSLACCRTSP